MPHYSPDEVVYNFGGLKGKQVIIDGTTYTINYVKVEKMSRQLQAQMTDGSVIAMNQDDEYEFTGLVDAKEFSAPTKGKARGKRRKKS